MEDKELMAAIGQVVVGSAVLEYSVAVLVAMTDGHRDQDSEDHALAIVKKTGRAMRELRMRACAQKRGQGVPLQQIARRIRIAQEFSFDANGRRLAYAEKVVKSEKAVREDLARWDRDHPGAVPQARCDLMARWQDAVAVLDDRNVIAHSVALEDIEAGGHAGLVILHPRTGMETQLTAPVVLSHVQDIRIAHRRFYDAIAAESSADPSGT